ncbi:hypothetical protein IMSAGC011_02450 [Lachnospiraceae bacterium]|nr:hypothetical protein IMSAGC011_02450 [Lachnospiraceae bacterium]
MDNRINQVLRRIMYKIYEQRKSSPKYPRTEVRYEKVQDRTFSEVWFMTLGCSHDRDGGCTMCNYGKGHYVNRDEILQELRTRIKELPNNLQELIVNPTGSMLDEEEVPTELFIEILKILEPVSTVDFLIETRADTVSEEKLDLLKQYIHAENIFIEMGVESCNNWILRNCVNKNMDLETVREALQMIHSKGLYACANIGIGIPFLNERISIQVAINSVKTALEMGFDSIVLFPYHIKPGTLSEYLWRQGNYECCSLWALVEVLNAFSPNFLEKIHISWYRNYYNNPDKVILSPDTCDECREKVLEALDAYKNYPGAKALERLSSFTCTCRDLWNEKMLLQPVNINLEEISSLYRQLGHAFAVPDEIIKEEEVFMNRTYGGIESV